MDSPAYPARGSTPDNPPPHLIQLRYSATLRCWGKEMRGLLVVLRVVLRNQGIFARAYSITLLQHAGCNEDSVWFCKGTDEGIQAGRARVLSTHTTNSFE